jgi:hypothetical protein
VYGYAGAEDKFRYRKITGFMVFLSMGLAVGDKITRQMVRWALKGRQGTSSFPAWTARYV